MSIPYADSIRSDTGFTNARLGLWLFLASEAMLFGALFSCYAFLRGGSLAWPHGSDYLNVPLGTANTLVLIASGFTMLRSRLALSRGDFRSFRRFLGATIVRGALFLAVEGYEYGTKFEENLFPKTNTFLAIYFMLTSVHAAHLVGGLILNGYLWARGNTLWRTDPAQWRIRGEASVLYWHFVDIVWLILYSLFYLL